MKSILFFLLLLSSFFVQAQQAKLYAAKNEKGIYVDHKVQPKENWYSVGRLYAMSPKDIAAFNGLSMDKGLSIGQALKVPLTANNFIQTVSAVGVPVYHEVQPKEGLLKVASTYGVTLAGIKNLNNLTSDQINTGYNLIVGYLSSATTAATVNPAANKAPESVTQPAAAPVKVPEPVAQSKPASATAPTKTTEPVAQPKQTSTAATVKTTETVAQPKSASTTPTPAATPTPVKVVTNGANYFSSGFAQQAKEGKEQKLDNPIYGIFKSSSGWQDGKYYMLMNDVVPGTIVKVSANESGKTIHAKVLGAVPPGKESEGMQLRLSNAAAAALGVENSGSVSLVWYK